MVRMECDCLLFEWKKLIRINVSKTDFLSLLTGFLFRSYDVVHAHFCLHFLFFSSKDQIEINFYLSRQFQNCSIYSAQAIYKSKNASTETITSPMHHPVRRSPITENKKANTEK